MRFPLCKRHSIPDSLWDESAQPFSCQVIDRRLHLSHLERQPAILYADSCRETEFFKPQCEKLQADTVQMPSPIDSIPHFLNRAVAVPADTL